MCIAASDHIQGCAVIHPRAECLCQVHQQMQAGLAQMGFSGQYDGATALQYHTQSSAPVLPAAAWDQEHGPSHAQAHSECTA